MTRTFLVAGGDTGLGPRDVRRMEQPLFSGSCLLGTSSQNTVLDAPVRVILARPRAGGTGRWGQME